MYSCAVAIFVKTPSLSPVKTRLARDLGSDTAQSMYLESVRAVEQSVAEAASTCSFLRPFWAVAETEGLADPLWNRFERISQGAGDLGERMAQVYATLKTKFDSVVLIGSDSPQLLAGTFITVAELLKEKDLPQMVVGPAYDGGFFLIGSNASLLRSFWVGVPYSSDTTLSELLRRVPKTFQLTLLPTESDLDTIEDLWALRAALLNAPLLTVQQQHLLDNIGSSLRLSRGVAFCCPENLAVSQIAEVITRSLLSANLTISSVNTLGVADVSRAAETSELEPMATKALRALGIVTTSFHLQSAMELKRKHFDLLIHVGAQPTYPREADTPTQIHLPASQLLSASSSAEFDTEVFCSACVALKTQLSELFAPLLKQTTVKE